MAKQPKRRGRGLPTQGKRSGVQTDDLPVKDGGHMESIDNFYDQARTPEEKKDDDPSGANKGSESARSRRGAKPSKGPVRQAAGKVRLSLPGQDAEGDDASTSTATSEGDGKQFNSTRTEPRKIMGVPSPSELSKVSTLPPTPGTELKHDLFSPEGSERPVEKPSSQVQDVVEVARLDARDKAKGPATPAEEDDEPDFAMHQDDGDDDDDGDDLAPPMMEDQEAPLAPETPAEEMDLKPAAKTNLPDNKLSDTESDDDDDDKEGPGFNIVHDPETPDTARGTRASKEDDEARARGKKKKSSKRRDSEGSDDKTPAARKSKKKKNRRVVFSPQGIPIGNRDYERIPVVEPSPDDGAGLRRSRRTKLPPLAFWKNEKVEYGPPDEDLVEQIGEMPVPTHVVKALNTPYRKRKEPTKAKATTKNGKSKSKKHRSEREEEEDDDEPFDPSALKRKYKQNLMKDEVAHVWDDGNDDLNDLKVVSYAERMEAAELPLSSARSKEEGNVVGSAAQAFNIPSDANDNYVGYIMGNLLLPPRGIKDAESVGPCSQTFTVCTGQKKALEVAFADPDGPEGMLDDDSAQRFLLGPGDLFRVPPGNTYRLQNHSRTKPCLLTWTIIRPRNPPPPPATSGAADDQESP